MSIWGDPVLIGNNGAVPPYTPPSVYNANSSNWYGVPEELKTVGDYKTFFQLRPYTKAAPHSASDVFTGKFFLAKITDIDLGDNYPHIVVFTQNIVTSPYDEYVFQLMGSASVPIASIYDSVSYNSMLETKGRSYRILPTLNITYYDYSQGRYVSVPVTGWPIGAVVLEGPLIAVKDFIANYNGPW